MKLAFGPKAPGFGSWEWIGQDLINELGPDHAIAFDQEIPSCDAVVFIKFKPPLPFLRHLKRFVKLIYCPVDIYGSVAEIDADWESLRLFDCIVSHATSLSKYFRAYSRTTVLDHHVKFITSMPSEQKCSGPILWTGQMANLPPVVKWIRRHPLKDELWILTNMGERQFVAADFGFALANTVRIQEWTPEIHCEWASIARLAIDVKGQDFRARHKPPTKAMDSIASGLPVAMNLDSGPAKDLARRGFSVVSPDDWESWTSREYWETTQRFGHWLNQNLTRSQIARKFLELAESL
ncbi:hypothetical protein KOR42_45240 [Thalassoglobus neptunius]|uniref:Glycosyl transferases group 1 n=1 Tax=Thalassoglobus neptunius TaxID=1938619 RepID=A0A5C5VX53_9PLAN|nr:hypothetical protein [Thalassoglobus neptunius]TWT43064.1 hypothetical protein KOR42_45240 [Thalassoglobus neptunius]